MATSSERAHAITMDPEFQAAVLQAVHGDLTGLTPMDDEHLVIAARSVSVMVAARVVESAPCSVAGFSFFPDSGVMTFDQDDPDVHLHLLPVTIARMIAIDASALMQRDFDAHAGELWSALLAAVPLSARRRMTLLLAGKFTCALTPSDPYLEEEDDDE